ncbi:DNA polymerase III subunit gamma and tau [Streptomyces sp. YIM 130001]|uniref:DNA polymerase III subunit gamma and tau n=1 Tax=Streptomyces sp. YIM 130001 TaxID=2259644 RepID=UPI000E659726|nr:DNA polymerase III subunit gamma and tau [Streptomyces sp. YIM 130001]
MSSLALYRRYRPESFAEVIGQEHVTDPLQQALRNNRVNHAYLFSGPRGCGKTTSARILARCLNCEQGPTPTPCGECQSCQDLARSGPGSIDVIEIDAASHGGVDDARDLREKAFFGPASSRYKIYIIDEAHMVTPAGFNALLKVVEEPPEHLKFIFATTEPEKVIGTIRSRTHHYPFRLVPPGVLRDYLGEVCGREKAPVADGVLPLVVRAGAGSVRDSMSVMDQLLAGAGDEGVTYEMATGLLGYTDSSLLDSVVEAFASGDGAAAFEIVDRVIEGGNDPRRFVADLLERLRDLVILAAVPDAADKGLIDAPADVVERMQAQAGVFGATELSRAADLVNEGLTEMRGATSPRLQLELICARVLLPAAYDDERAVMARLDRLERGAGGVSAGITGAQVVSGGPAMAYAPEGAHAQVPPAGPPQSAPSGPPVPPGGGPAAARAAVRGQAPEQAAPQPAAAPPASPAPEAAPAPAPATPAPAPDPVAEQPQPPVESAPQQGEGAAAARPGAWPGAQQAAPAAEQQGARRPGGWPTAAPAGGGRPAPAQPQQPTAPQQAAPPPAAPAAPAAPSGPPQGGGLDARTLWPNILEAVKNRRRFTWILLSQNAQVTGFDGQNLQIGFINAGARDNFTASGSEDVLRQALAEQFHVNWKIEAIVDPSGGSAPPPAAPGSGGGAPAAPRPSAPPAAPQPERPAGPAPAAQQAPPDPAPAPAPPERSRVSIEDDVPEDDDPDLDESALSGHDLIVRELGATVVEEFTNE